MHYQTKKPISGISTVKGVDKQSGIVEGYFSVFDELDADDDIIRQGSYFKSIEENGPSSNNSRIKHLLQHDTRQPIGLLIELKEDEFGLFFRSKISQSRAGKDTLIQYDEGILTEHSVGINVLDADADTGGPRIIKEVKLWEGSTVTWGAQELARVKSLSPAVQRKELTNQIESWSNFLRKTRASDEMCQRLEIHLNQIKEYLDSLSLPGSGDPTPGADDDSMNLEGLNYFKQKIGLS